MPPPTTTPLRADARRNRDQILDAAARAFVEVGPDVPMDEIARRAGVGVGTLYRRFADRESLVVAVVRNSLDALRERVRTATENEPRAWDALVQSMSFSRELRLSLPSTSELPPGLAGAVRNDPGTRQVREELTGMIVRLVTAAQQEGSLRTDVGPGDVTQLFALVYRAAPTRPDDPADLATNRALAVILDGLTTRGHTPLPGQPLGAGDLRR